MSTTTAEAAIVGAGPAGLVAALALAHAGIEAFLIAPPHDATQAAAADRRTTALIGPSIALLENLGVWRFCESEAEPLVEIRLADDRKGLIRLPEARFQAAELGLATFGANIANTALVAALEAAASHAPRLSRIATQGITRAEPGPHAVRLTLAEGGSVDARLAVAADGRNSITRAAAGISVRTWDYPQAALVASFTHSRPHHGVVYELHRQAGPLTTVPLPGSRSALVRVEQPAEAQRLALLEDSAFAAELEERLQGLLGAITHVEPRARHPLMGLTATPMAAARTALVGEAGHVVPPIGAQGLNLGLRDAAALAECVGDAQARGEDIGAPGVLAAYDRARRLDVLAYSWSIDLLNRSLLSDFLPLQLLRSAAGHVALTVDPLRRLLMQGGLGLAAGPLPRLMRPGAACT